jgi:phage repressor protein C with HTH and peptisase S24 domain
MSLASNIARRMTAAGFNQKSLARAAGLNETGIRDILIGRSRNPRVDTLGKIAKALGCTVAELAEAAGAGGGEPAPNVQAGVEAPLPAFGKADVPVLGTAIGGSRGDFAFNGQTVDFVRRLPGIAERKEIFAIFASGSSMEPWRFPGDPVYLDPHRSPRIGDHVVVECAGRDGEPGPAYLKRLVARSATKLRLGQYNPPSDKIEIDLKRVKRLYRVIDWGELVGI